MATYRYIFADLLTNAVLAELPLKKVTFDSKLNDIGSLSGSLPMADSQVTKLQPWSNTPGGRTALYVDRQGVLVWGGIVVTRRYSGGSNAPGGSGAYMLDIGASEMFWYFRDKRAITADVTFTNIEQLTIATNLINTAQAVASGNIGASVLSINPSGTSVLRTQTWRGSDRKKVGQALMDTAVLDNGFDWQLRIGYGLAGQPAGVPGKQLALGYPRLGNPFTTSGWVFEFPGNIVDYSWPEDSALQAVTAYVQGTGSGAAMIQSSNTVTSLLDAGYPLLEEVFAAKDQVDPNAIAARAVSFAKAYSNPVTLPQLLVRADMDPVLGSYSVGDDCLLRLTSPQFPAVAGGPGYTGFWRIIQMQVQPQDDGQPERVTLTLGAIPV